MKERRIVQFALGGDYRGAGMHRSPEGELLYALDEEGMLWSRPLTNADAEDASSAGWVAFPALPERGAETTGLEKLPPARDLRLDDEAATPAPAGLSLESRAASPAVLEEAVTPEIDKLGSEPQIDEPKSEPEPARGEEGRVAAEYEGDELTWVHPPLSPRTLLEEGLRRAEPPLSEPGFHGGVHPAERDDV